ncbi:hypothetical protein ACQKWADRAFT_280598 [Trichoderma austrokoningii]
MAPELQGRDPATDAHGDLWRTTWSFAAQPMMGDLFQIPVAAWPMSRSSLTPARLNDTERFGVRRETQRPQQPLRTICSSSSTIAGAIVSRQWQSLLEIRRHTPISLRTSRRHDRTCHSSSAVL